MKLKLPRYDPKKEEKKQILREMEEDKSMRPKREIFGVEISRDHGQTWRTEAICDKCFSQIAPPTRAKKGIEAGAGSCDWCGALNKNRRK